jgi:hypothetical protein
LTDSAAVADDSTNLLSFTRNVTNGGSRVFGKIQSLDQADQGRTPVQSIEFNQQGLDLDAGNTAVNVSGNSVSLSSQGSIAISSSGGANVDINSSGQINLNSAVRMSDTVSIANGGVVISQQYGGSVEANTVRASSFVTLSDGRLKQNVTPIQNASRLLADLGGYYFNWRDPSKAKGRQVGLIAQDVQKVLPEAVTRVEKSMLAVDYSKLVPLLVQAIKEQQKELGELKNAVRKSCAEK